MIDGISNEVHQRFGEGIENALIEVGVLPGDFQRNILPTGLGDIANDARKAPEELLDGNHANFQHALVQLVQNARLKSHGVGKFGAHGVTRVLLIEFRECAVEHGLANNQLAYQIHDRIDAGGVHAERALGHRDGRGTSIR